MTSPNNLLDNYSTRVSRRILTINFKISGWKKFLNKEIIHKNMRSKCI